MATTSPQAAEKLNHLTRAWHHRLPLPERKQYEPELVQPHGHVPFSGFGTASCAPCDGTQYDPLDVYPCGQLPPRPGGFGFGCGSGSATAAVAMTAASAAMMVVSFILIPSSSLASSSSDP
jgi:hypothetical protein